MGSSVLFWLAFKVLISWEVVSRGARKSSFRGGCFSQQQYWGKSNLAECTEQWLRRPGLVETKGKWEAKVCVGTRNVMPGSLPMDKGTVQSNRVTAEVLTACCCSPTYLG